MEVTKWLKPSDKRVTFAQPRNVRFNLPTSSVVPCHVIETAVIAWIFSTMRRMLFFDGR